MNLAEKKAELRKEYRWLREERFDSKNSWEHVATCFEIAEATYVASYISYGTEPRTDEINSILFRDGKKVVIPRLLADKSLEWVIWNGDSSELVTHGNIKEPVGPAIDPSLIDVAIVPALHIDRTGNRLGQGGGSYDRALRSMRAWKIALVHIGEITSEPLPVNDDDQKVDAAATPELIVRF